MLKKRIIPCLDIRDGRTVKGIHFEQLRDAGDPVALARQYAAEGADELVFLDITATVEKRKTLCALVSRVAKAIHIPFTVGGGINSVADAIQLIQSGADKISVNTAAVQRPGLIGELAARLGSQCVVVAIDTRINAGQQCVFTHGGRQATSLFTTAWARQAAAYGAGEILLTAMGKDGTGSGFDLTTIQEVCQAVSLPVIASGGAGCPDDFKTLFETTEATAALAAGVFHFGKLRLPELKAYLKTAQIPIR
ncbi:imidazole glycerol phosphate synthase subunit HisF [Taibaiella koreensis]|uniref:imidazole glycerol phosphate synthase subunit HisF n=1 Tax=Taibaiella koreensis TaxID=1268548 RepID=UPI000E5A079E|nr:imidazole glycerol phosphate synthase subunit HisF [Taibaiella koreensis]